MFFTFNACDLDPKIYSEYDREDLKIAKQLLILNWVMFT